MSSKVEGATDPCGGESAPRALDVSQGRECLHRVVALMSIKSPTLDPDTMRSRKAALQAAAASVDRDIDAYVVDLLPSSGGTIYARPVRDLVRWARTGSLDIVVIDDLDDLSIDRDAAFFVAVLLVESGVRVIEAGWSSRHSIKASTGPRGQGSRTSTSLDPAAGTSGR